MSTPVVADSILPTLLTRMLEEDGSGDDGVFFGAVLHLFQNDVTPSKSMVIGDFVGATYTGAPTPTLATPLGPVVDPDGSARVYWPAVEDIPGDDVTPNTIYGYYVVTSGGDLIYAERFDAPVPMLDTNDAIAFIPSFVLPNPS